MEITHKNQGELDSTMLPFVMRELVELVMKKKALPLGDALYYIYSSKLYKSLLDKSTKLWYSSTLSLYETLQVHCRFMKHWRRKKQKKNDGITVTRRSCFSRCSALRIIGRKRNKVRKKPCCCFRTMGFLIFWMRLLKCFIPKTPNIY